MKRLMILCACLMTAMLMVAQTQVGDWTSYLAYHNNTYNVSVGEEIYSLCDGNLFAYDTRTTEVRLLSKMNGMNGKYVQFMGYSAGCKCLVLVYDDANVDLMLPDGTFWNIPQLKNAGLEGVTMNSLTVNGDWAVLATSTGIVIFDLSRKELRGVYNLGEKIYASTVFDGQVFVAREATILACPLTSNLSDQTLWLRQQYVAARSFVHVGERLYFTVQYFVNPFPVGLWYVTKSDATGQREWLQVSEQYYPLTYSDGSTALLANASEVVMLTPSKPEPALTFQHANSWAALSRTTDGRIWASEGLTGLQAYRMSGETLAASDLPIGDYGPIRDLCYHLRYADERLLVAGGWLDYSGAMHPGTLMQYEDGEWTIFQEEGVEDATGIMYRNMTSIVQDPNDPTHHYATSANTGLYEFRDYKFVRQYTNSNSPLKSALADGTPIYVITDGLNYDAQGNLWMVNNQTDTIIHVLKTDGTWGKVYVEDIRLAPTPEKTLFDRKGRLWICSRRTVSNHTAGLLCLDYNGTIDNDKDDVSRYRTDCINEDGQSVKLNGVYDIAEDQNGQLWVGTGDGLFVVENPDEWFDSDFTILQVKVPRNDGTNYADYLLADIPVSAIAVDGANRKWIGTYGSGLYLVSPDGTEILEHFTAEESSLFSNSINSLAINPETGELMIGTNVGLCSYQTHVSAPSQTLDKDAINVYPNPVRPDYNGSVVLTGLTADADVKVTSTAGQVVAAGRSTGGTYVWDCRDFGGNRVATGVYYFMVSTAMADSGIVAKIVVL